MSIGARSQSAKTYLEKHFEKFLDCESRCFLGHQSITSRWGSCFECSDWITISGDLDELIKHGLHALRDTLQQDKELTTLNTSLGIVGPSHKFEIIEGDALAPYLARMDPKDDGTAQPAPMETDPWLAWPPQINSPAWKKKKAHKLHLGCQATWRSSGYQNWFCRCNLPNWFLCFSISWK